MLRQDQKFYWVWTGVEFLEMCNMCASETGASRVIEIAEERIPHLTCQKCLKNSKTQQCIRCHATCLFFQRFTLPRFGGTMFFENWGDFSGMITVTLCRKCIKDGWTLRHTYIVDGRVMASRSFEQTEYITIPID